MKTNFLIKTAILFTAMLFLNSSYAQNTLTGSVVDDSNQPLPGVNIIIQGTSIGTTTDFDGNFSFKTDNQIPLSIEASYLGFNTQIIEVNSANQIITITLASGNSYLDEIIVSASRRPEKILNAPASVSVITAKDLENGPTSIDPFAYPCARIGNPAMHKLVTLDPKQGLIAHCAELRSFRRGCMALRSLVHGVCDVVTSRG